MAPIQTFIFMDFGTARGNSKVLTEVGLLAVPRSQYLQPENIQAPKTKKVRKLKSNGFDMKIFKVINNFINKQKQPVCLVSHNGHEFDFIILKRELQRLNVSLFDGVLCADSLYIFYDILKDDPRNVDNTNIESVSNKLEKQDPKTGEEENSYSNTSNFNGNVDVTSDQKADYKQVANFQGNELKDDFDEESMQMQNESTPSKRKFNVNNEPIKAKNTKLHHNHSNLGNAKRNLDKTFDDDLVKRYRYTGKPIRTTFFEGYPTPPKGHNTLGAIYDREVIHPRVKHHPAKNDVYSKFRISHKLGRRFLAWTDQIQYEFAKVEIKDIVFGKRGYL